MYNLKFIFISCLLIVLASCDAKTKSEKYMSKARQAEAKLALASTYNVMVLDQVENGKYSKKTFEEYVDKNFNTNKNIYQLLDSHKSCPDCGISDDKFKIIAVGNIDKDETNDVWTLNQDKELVNIISDVEL